MQLNVLLDRLDQYVEADREHSRHPTRIGPSHDRALPTGRQCGPEEDTCLIPYAFVDSQWLTAHPKQNTPARLDNSVRAYDWSQVALDYVPHIAPHSNTVASNTVANRRAAVNRNPSPDPNEDDSAFSRIATAASDENTAFATTAAPTAAPIAAPLTASHLATSNPRSSPIGSQDYLN